jgi:tripartite-type tricarboxylate transporter receptor subunit TctC
MPAAAGRVTANWLASLAPRDGSVIATISNTAPTDQARKQEGVQYDATQFGWIGTAVSDNTVTIAARDAGYLTLDDVIRKGGLVCAGLAASTPSVTLPFVINHMLGANIKVVSGYPGSSEADLAFRRGEANCVAGSMSSLEIRDADLLRDGKLSFLVQWGVQKNPDIEKFQGGPVPLGSEFAKTPLDSKALAVINEGLAIGRPIVTAPGVPSERVAVLRRAFDAAMTDPEFISEALKHHINLAPISGTKLQTMAADIATVAPDVLSRVDQLLSPK